MGEIVRAAGALLWREGPTGLEIAIVHRPKYDDWSLPKGKLDAGETDLEAALREVAEETGHRGDPGPGLGEIRYQVEAARGPADKVVVYWAMRSKGGTFAPTGEIDALRWVPPGEAAAALTYARDREVVDRFLDQWAQERPEPGSPA